MNKVRFTIVLSFLTFHLWGQGGPYMFSGTQYLSSGQIGILCENAEAGIVLPALLPVFEKGGWSAGASLRPGLDDLLELAATVHLPLPWKDHIALGIQHTGIEGYSEQRITLSYARHLFKKMNVAAQFDLNRNIAEGYDDVYGPSWSVSMVAPLMKEVSMSAWIYNPLGDVGTLDLPSMARLGVLYQPSDKIGAAVEVEKDWKHDARFKAGIQYQLHPRLGLRMGMSTDPGYFHAGISWHIFDQMALSGGWQYNTRLGSELSAGLSQYRVK